MLVFVSGSFAMSYSDYEEDSEVELEEDEEEKVEKSVKEMVIFCKYG